MITFGVVPNVIIAHGLHLELLDTQEILIQEHVMTLANFYINTHNLSNVAWYLSG